MAKDAHGILNTKFNILVKLQNIIIISILFLTFENSFDIRVFHRKTDD